MVTKNYFSTHSWSGVVAMIAVVLLSFIPTGAYAQVTDPTDVHVTTLTPTSATLGWQWTTTTVDRHDIDIRVSTVALPLTGTYRDTVTTATEGVVLSEVVANLPTPTHTISPLTEGTFYYVYMRENGTHDNQGSSDWVTLTFATPCSATSDLPGQSFDDSSERLPECWSSLGTAPTISTIHYGDNGYSVKLDGTSASSYLYSPILSSTSQGYYLTAYVYGAAGAKYKVGFAATDDWLDITPVLEGTISTGNSWTAIDAVLPADAQAQIESGTEFLWVIYSAEGDNSFFYVDEVAISQLPPCVAPSTLEVSDITSNSAQLSWTERGTATSWAIEYNDGTDLSYDETEANPVTISPLKANNAYTVRVQANCGEESSEWTEWVSFKTLCGVENLPYKETFDSYTGVTSSYTTRPANGTLPDCWSADDNDNNFIYVVSNHAYGNSSNGLDFSATRSVSEASYAFLPAVNAPTGAILTLKYKYENTSYGTLTVGYVTVAGDKSTFVPVSALTPRTTFTASDDIFLPATATVDGILYPAIQYVVNNYYYACIDDVELVTPPTCLKPTDLHLASFDAESATLVWTANGSETNWELTYQLGNNDAVTVSVENTPQFTLEDLTANTAYTLSNLSLRAACSVTDSSAVASFSNISFKTKCAAVTIYETDFEDETSGSGTMPECWTKVSTTSSNYPYVYSSGYYAHSGTQSLYATYDYDSWSYASYPLTAYVALPEVSGDLQGYRLTFYAKASLTYDDRDLIIGVMTDVNDIATFVSVDTITPTSSYTDEPDTVLFGGYEGSGKFVTIKYDTILTSIYIDDVVLEPIPTCEKPGAISAAASYDKIKLSWLPGGDETKWQVSYQVGEDDVQTFTVENNPEYTISGLEGSTEYTLNNISVKAVCSEDNISNARVLSTLTIKTKCAPQALPLSETFEFISSGIPSCWDNSETTVTTASYNWNSYSTGASGRGLRFNSYYPSSGQFGVLKTPIFTVLTDRAVELTFQYKNPTGGDFSVYVSRDGGMTMEEEALLSGLTGQTDWTEVSVSFDAAATDNLVICFKAISNCGSGNAYIDLDEVNIKAPLCSKPYGTKVIAVTDNSVELSWTNTGAASYKALLFASEPTTIAEASALSVKEVETNAVSFEELSANTLYYVYIQGICDEENSEYSKVFSFRTACAAEELPYAENFDDGNALLCWKTIGNAATLSSSSVAFGGSGKALALTTDSVNVMLVSPKFNVASLADYNVNLAAYSNTPATLAIGVIVDLNNPADTYTDLGSIDLTTARQWNEYSFSFAVLSEEGYEDYANAQYIAISVPTHSSVIIDAVEVVEPARCAKPTAITIETLGKEVSIDWTSEADSHEAMITSADTVAFSGVVSKPFVPEELVANSDYQIKVRAICPVEDQDEPITSEWSALVAFKTPCTLAPMPFAEDFSTIEAPAATYSSDVADNAVFPDCWDYLNNGTHLVSVADITNYNDGNLSSITGKYVQFAGGSEAYVFLPAMDGSEGWLVLSLDYALESTSSSGSLVVGYVTSPSDASTFVALSPLENVATLTSAEVIFPQMAVLYPAVKFIPNSASYLTIFGNVKVDVVPSCIKPSGLTVGDVTPTSAKVSWTPNGDEEHWQLIYKQSGKTKADTVIVNDTPEYTLENLTSGTNYTLSNIQLRAICSEMDSSEIVEVSTLSFQTECAISTLPFDEDFNSLTAGIPACWDNSEGTTTTDSYKWNYYAEGYDGGGVRFNSYNNSSGNTDTLKTPVIAVPAGTEAILSFYYKNPTGGNYAVVVSHDGGVSFAETIANGLTASVWTLFKDTITPATDEQIVIAFCGTSNYGYDDAYLYLDEIEFAEPATCDRPTAVNVGAVTASSATINVVGGEAWEYVLNSTENAPVAVPENPFTIPALEAQTDYTVFVRTVCATDNKSEWRSASFTTLCGIRELPIMEGFEGTTFVPECWATNHLEGTDGGWSRSTSELHTGNASACLADASSGNRNILATPMFHSEEANALRVSFWMKRTSYSTIKNEEGIRVWVNTVNNDTQDGTALIHVNREYSIGGEGIKAHAEEAAGWYKYTTTIPVAGDVYLLFEGISEWGAASYIDDILIEQVPDCDSPSALNLVAATDASLQIAITDVEAATVWEYALNDVEGEIHPLNNSTFLIDELDAQTEYTVYVRRVCSESVSSEWMSATFKTECPMQALPLVENFNELSAIPECWTNEHVAGSSSTVWSISSGRAYINYQYSGNQVILATPKVALQAGVAYRISFDTDHTLDSNYDDETHIYLAYSAKGDSIHQFCNIVYGGNVASGAVSHQYTFTPDEDMNVCLVVKRIFNYDYAFYMDNIVIEEVPACEKPQGVSVVSLSASQVTVQITDTASVHDAWQVIAGPKGFVVDEADVQAAPAKLATYVLANALNSGDMIDIYVRATCGEEDGNSPWFGPVRAKYTDYSTMVPDGITLVSTSAYTWDIVSDGGLNKLQSTNSGVVSACDMVLNITVAEGTMSTLSFNYLVSAPESYPSYGALYVYDNIASPTTANYTALFVGGSYDSYESTGSATMNLTEGNHTILFRYNKTDSYSYGQDLAQVWNIAVSSKTFFAPTDLHITSVSAERVGLAWSASGEATAYQINLKSTGLDAVLTTTGTTLTIDGLTAQTVYTAAIRSCNETDTTVYSTALRFTTPCAVVPLPLSESFEDLSDGQIPECWDNSEYTCSESYRWQYNSSAPTGHTGSDKAIRFNAYNASSGTTSTLLTPHINNGEVTKLRLSFYMQNGQNTTLDVKISLDGGVTYPLVAFNAEKGSSSWQQFNYSFEAEANSDIVVSFMATSDFGYYIMYLDEVVVEEVPACDKPSSVSVVSAEGAVLQLAVTDADAEHTAWDAVVVLKDSVVNEANVTTAANLITVTLDSALVSGTYYDIYVRTNCGEDSHSEWFGPVTYKYVDYSAVATGGSISSDGDYPWEMIDDGVAKMQSTNRGVNSSSSDLKGVFVVGEGEKGTLSFEYYAQSEESSGTIWDYLALYVDGNTYDPTFGRVGGANGMSGRYVLVLDEGTHSVVWRYYKDSSSSSGLDAAQVWNINFISTSAWAPTDLTVVEVGVDTAAIAWTQCENVVSSEVKIGETIYTSDNNAIVLRDLTPNTEYKAVVRSLFAEDEPTAWSDTLIFRTECAAFNLPYATGFEEADGGLNCWNVYQTQAGSGSGTDYGDEGWILYKGSSSSSVHTGTASAQLRDTKNGTHTVLVSPEFSASEDSVRISFWMYRDAGTNKQNEGVKLYVNSKDSLDGATALMHVTRCGGVAATDLKVAPITTAGWYPYEATVKPEGNFYFLFEGISEWGSASYIDDIRISRIAYAEPFNDLTCSTQAYEGYGFTLAQEDMHVGLNRLVRIEESESENAVDTVRVLELTVVESSITELSDTACAGSSYYKNGFHINSVRPNVQYRLDSTNIAGCDSIVYLTLYVPETNYTAAVTICEGEPYEFGTQRLTSSGEYQEPFTSVACGCDSIVTLTLTVLPAEVVIDTTICEGDSVLFNGEYRKEGSAYVANLTNMLGCDSVVTLNLTVLAKIYEARQGVFCSGSVYNDDDFVELDSAGVYTAKFTNAAGCDSIITLTLVEHAPEAVTIDSTIVQGTAIVIGGNTYTEADTYTIRLEDAFGCDSVITLHLTVSTDLEEVLNAQQLKGAEKFVHNGVLYIRANDILYDAQGKRVIVRKED